MEPWKETKKLQQKHEDIKLCEELAESFKDIAKLLDNIAEDIKNDDEESKEINMARYLIKLSKISKKMDEL